MDTYDTKDFFWFETIGSSKQSDGRIHIDIIDEPVAVEDEQPLHRPIRRNRAKKSASYSGSKNLSSSVIDHFREKSD